jgi:adenosine kinase
MGSPAHFRVNGPETSLSDEAERIRPQANRSATTARRGRHRSPFGVTSPPQVVVSASIAFDYVMSFNGSFKDHILADKAHVLSVSFLLDSLKQQRGGIGGNMAYSLALLKVPCALVGAVGPDFAPYGEVLERHGVDLALVQTVPDDFTSTSFMNADLAGNQIAAFYPGAGNHSAELDVADVSRTAHWGIISAAAPDAMIKHAEEIVAAGCRLVFDPAQQIVILDGDQLSRGIEIAEVVVGNDYEFGMMERKTGLTIEDIARKVPLTVVTYGDRGSEFRAGGEVVNIPIASADPFVDPTGGGDAFRSGMLKGLLLGKDLPVVGRLAALAATHAIEHHGPQEHSYTPSSFFERFQRAFPDYADSLSLEDLEGTGTHVAGRAVQLSGLGNEHGDRTSPC